MFSPLSVFTTGVGAASPLVTLLERTEDKADEETAEDE